ncbi:hypothetical protein D3C87_1191410 [compost metagenome]
MLAMQAQKFIRYTALSFIAGKPCSYKSGGNWAGQAKTDDKSKNRQANGRVAQSFADHRAVHRADHFHHAVVRQLRVPQHPGHLRQTVHRSRRRAARAVAAHCQERHRSRRRQGCGIQVAQRCAQRFCPALELSEERRPVHRPASRTGHRAPGNARRAAGLGAPAEKHRRHSLKRTDRAVTASGRRDPGRNRAAVAGRVRESGGNPPATRRAGHAGSDGPASIVVGRAHSGCREHGAVGR